MSRSVVRRQLFLGVVASIVALLFASPVWSQETATALVREDDTLPGAPGENVDSINNPVVNHVGGYGLTVNTSGSGTTLSHIWGNAGGGPGHVIITEGTYGDFQQNSFESFHGLSNAGVPAYSAISTSTITGTTGLDGVWLGTTPVLNEEDPIPTLPGQWSTFNSRPGVTADGIPYWVGGTADTQGASTQNRRIFFSTGLTPVVGTGDTIPGVAEPVENVDFDFRYSEFGTNYITQVLVDSSSTDDGLIITNGNTLLIDGMIVREASPVPASAGGLPGELWDNFDYFSITEFGDYLMTGDTTASTSEDEFVVLSGMIVLREGDMVNTPIGPLALSGSIEGGYMNEDLDWAVTWDVNAPAGNVEALILNGEVILMEGDAVDLDGDGVVEPDSILANFTGITSLVVGARLGGGGYDIYFTADIDTEGTSSSSDDTEGMFRISIGGTGENRPPIANAGDDETAECVSFDGATFTLDGSASFDPDEGDVIVSYEWFEGATPLGTGEMLDVTLSLGMHTITLQVTDSFGLTDTDEVIKTVVDTTPPELAVTLTPGTLWPPNHQMENVTATVIATDICSMASAVLLSVESNEADNAVGVGDGNTVNDIQGVEAGTPDTEFALRAERQGGGSGRVYTAMYLATDTSGNEMPAMAFVTVPHDQGGVTEPLEVDIYEGADGTVVVWDDLENAIYYNVIRGNLANIVETEEAIELGPVTCIEAASVDRTTKDWEDTANPEPGQVFFYVVEFYDGTYSSYGTESAPKPRVVPAGQCE
jgi:hypothetical protein